MLLLNVTIDVNFPANEPTSHQHTIGGWMVGGWTRNTFYWVKFSHLTNHGGFRFMGGVAGGINIDRG